MPAIARRPDALVASHRCDAESGRCLAITDLENHPAGRFIGSRPRSLPLNAVTNATPNPRGRRRAAIHLTFADGSLSSHDLFRPRPLPPPVRNFADGAGRVGAGALATGPCTDLSEQGGAD